MPSKLYTKVMRECRRRRDDRRPPTKVQCRQALGICAQIRHIRKELTTLTDDELIALVLDLRGI